MKNTDSYRRDIDGLRAVAVLAVVAYHAFPKLIAGGFVGVDVFFVISGFLITGILLVDHDKRAFTLRRFYARRIRRLFPALCTVLVACLVAGWFLLFPDEYRQLGKHVFAGSGFGSNILLWKETGYFDTEAEAKPLLHLWSLGIEEQFYLIWPLLLALVLWRGFKPTALLVVFSLGSFALSVKMAGTPSGFYLPFPRFWELFCGAILASLQARGWKVSHPALSWIGFGMLVAAFALVDRSRHFPGFWALLPVGGSVLMLVAGPDGAVNRFLLSRRAMVGVGLISYPLYLWHWPLLAFARVIYSGTPPAGLRLALVAASFVLSYATYRFVEKPLRFGMKSRFTPLVLAGVLAVIALFGLVLARRSGLPARYGAAARDLVYDVRQFNYVDCEGPLATGEPSLLYCVQSSRGATTRVVIGDSHADHLFPGIAATDHDHVWLLAAHPSCPPTSGIDVHVDEDRCRERSQRVLDYVGTTASIDAVVFAYFSGYTQDTDFAFDHVVNHDGPTKVTMHGSAAGSKSDLLFEGLDRAISEVEHAGKQVVLVEDVPELPFMPRACLPRSSLLSPVQSRCEIERARVVERQAGPRAIVAHLQKAHPQLRVFDSLDAVCSATTCPVMQDGRLIYRDSHHLSAYGSELFARAFIAWLAAK